MNLAKVTSLIFGGINIAADLLEYLGELKGWTGGPKLASELRDVAERSKTAFRTDPVFKAEMDSGQLSHIWNEAGDQIFPSTGGAAPGAGQ